MVAVTAVATVPPLKSTSATNGLAADVFPQLIEIGPPLLLVAFTVRLTVVVWLRLPEVPVTVTVAVPVVAVLLAVSVRVLVPVVLAGLNDAVTPLGNPEAERATLPVKPPVGFTVMVDVPLAPWFTDRLEGEDVSV